MAANQEKNQHFGGTGSLRTRHAHFAPVSVYTFVAFNQPVNYPKSDIKEKCFWRCPIGVGSKGLTQKLTLLAPLRQTQVLKVDLRFFITQTRIVCTSQVRTRGANVITFHSKARASGGDNGLKRPGLSKIVIDKLPVFPHYCFPCCKESVQRTQLVSCCATFQGCRTRPPPRPKRYCF